MSTKEKRIAFSPSTEVRECLVKLSRASGSPISHIVNTMLTAKLSQMRVLIEAHEAVEDKYEVELSSGIHSK